MLETDNLIRGISENGGVVFYGIDSTAIVREMERLHKTSAVTTAALGRLLTGAAMMGAMLKSRSDSLTLQINGGGPAGRPFALSIAKTPGRCTAARRLKPAYQQPFSQPRTGP